MNKYFLILLALLFTLSNTANAETLNQEAQKILAQCKGTMKMSSKYDCECYAQKFQEKRDEVGTRPNEHVIMSHIKTECLALDKMAEASYKECMNGSKSLHIRYKQNIKKEAFCGCIKEEQTELQRSRNPADYGHTFQMKMNQLATNICLDKF